tara:strand:- start:39 stop:305 length:267 start_codon:yes stop_codon:yes gene_type:complete
VEAFAIIFIVIALGSTILVKYLATVRTIRLREQLLAVEGDLRIVRGKVKQAENQRLIVKRELKQAERQKKALEKRANAAESELTGLRK